MCPLDQQIQTDSCGRVPHHVSRLHAQRVKFMFMLTDLHVDVLRFCSFLYHPSSSKHKYHLQEGKINVKSVSSGDKFLYFGCLSGVTHTLYHGDGGGGGQSLVLHFKKC